MKGKTIESKALSTSDVRPHPIESSLEKSMREVLRCSVCGGGLLRRGSSPTKDLFSISMEKLIEKMPRDVDTEEREEGEDKVLEMLDRGELPKPLCRRPMEEGIARAEFGSLFPARVNGKWRTSSKWGRVIIRKHGKVFKPLAWYRGKSGSNVRREPGIIVESDDDCVGVCRRCARRAVKPGSSEVLENG